MKILSWNVNGIRAALKKGFEDKVREMAPDILCIQEIKADEEVMKSIAAEIDHYHVYSNSAEKKGYAGTAIYTKQKPLSHTYDIGKKEHDQEGRVITLEYEDFYLVNV